jgi:hypothetical protein
VAGGKLETSKVKRKTFVAREDLIDRLSEIAKQKGYSLYSIVNEVFELAVKAEETGVDLRKIIEERSVLKAAREAGFLLGLESLWYEMAELAYQKAKTQALKSWYEAGVWLAKRYATGEVEDAFAAFKKDLEAFTWNAPEFTIEKTEDKISVRIISPRFTESYTVLLTSFLEGALDAFGYKTTSKEISRGAIRLEAFKEEEADAPA